MPECTTCARAPYNKDTAIADRQRKKGIDTYGQGLERNTADMLTRIEYLEEELVDGLMYCEWMKDKLVEGGVHEQTTG